MSNYNNLKTTIDANIKQNGNQEITGPILNSVLNQMVNILGTGYQFAGIATLDPANDPGTPDAKVFYIANGKGKYTNFGGIEVTEDEVVVLYWDTTWHKVSTGIASNQKLSELEKEIGLVKKLSKNIVGTTTENLFTDEDVPIGTIIHYDFVVDNCRVYILHKDSSEATRLNEDLAGHFTGSFVIDSNFASLTYKAFSGSVEISLSSNLTNEELREDIDKLVLADGKKAEITNPVVKSVYTPISLLRIKQGDVFNVRISGNFTFGRILLGYNGSTSSSNILKDYVENGVWYTFTAPTDIESLSVLVFSGATGNLIIETFPENALYNNVRIVESLKDIPNIVLKKLDIKPGKNLYSNPVITAGFFITSTGSLTSHSSRSVSDFISLNENTTYHISIAGDGHFDDNDNVCFAFYDTNKNFISAVPASTKTLTTPAGTAYIRLSGYTYKFSNYPQIELGNTRTAYESYSPIGGYIKMPEVVSDFNPLIGKKVLCFGDSITEFKDDRDKGYCEYLAEMSGASVLRAGVGASWLTARMTPVASPSSVNEARAAFDVCNLVDAWIANDFTKVDAANTFLIAEGDDNTQQVNTLKNNAINDIDVITIFAGTNDFNNSVDIGENGDASVQTILGAYHHLISAICSANKAIRVFIFTPIVRYFDSTLRTDPYWSDIYTNADVKTLRDYANAIVDCANYEHIGCCNLYDTLGWNKYNFSNYFLDNDGTHPYKGFSQIARRMFSFICSSY